MNGKNQNIVGNQYGCLTVQKLAYKKSRKLYYTCLCECGCEVDVRKDQLIRGITKSCGCLQKDIAEKTMTENMKKHGLSNHPLHRIFNSMKQRCYNEMIRDLNIMVGVVYQSVMNGLMILKHFTIGLLKVDIKVD